MRSWILALSSTLIFSVTGAAQQNSDSALKAQLLTMPPPAMADLAQSIGSPGQPARFDVTFLRADLDGSQRFNFIVAFFFTVQSRDGYLRVYRQDGGSLTVAGDEETASVVSGRRESLSLVDVNGDGIPEVRVDSMGLSGAHTGFDLFSWTGSSLHLLTPNTVDTTDASLVDIDGDGQLEIVQGPYIDFNDPDSIAAAKQGSYDIYRLSGNQYVLSTTSGTDPKGLHGQNGTINLVRAFFKRIEPGKFPLAEIHEAQAGHGDDDGRVVLTLGKLQAFSGSSVSVEDINVTSLRLGQGLSPVATRIAGRDSEKEAQDSSDSNPGPVLKAYFSRSAVLAFLPHAQLDKPLAPGDTLTLPIRGNMKNGAALSGTVTMKIVGDRDDDGAKHE